MLGFKETDKLKRLGHRQLHDALKLLPARDTASYMKACEHIPDLVKLESDPLLFLHIECFNPWTAARRLASYWNRRVEVFGEKAFSSQSIAFEHAKQCNNNGHCHNPRYLQLLPTKAGSSSAIYITISGLNTRSLDTIRQDLFIACQSLSTQSTQFSGVDLLVLMNDPPTVSFRQAMIYLAQLFQRAMPLKFHQLYLISYSPSEGRTAFLENILPLVLEGIPNFLSKRGHNICVSESQKEVLDFLCEAGFHVKDLVGRLGGVCGIPNKTRKLGDVEVESLTVKPRAAAAPELIQKVLLEYQNKTMAQPLGSVYNTPVQSKAQMSLANPRFSATMNLPMSHDNFSADIMKELDGALSKIPIEEKLEHYEATQRCPKLMWTESNPEHYVQAANGNVEVAARSLVAYWRYRKLFFGFRAFKPMVLIHSSESALDDKDLAVLNTGFTSLLPDNRDGRLVIYHNREKFKNIETTQIQRIRCIFYILQDASQEEKSRLKGVVIISAVGDFPIKEEAGPREKSIFADFFNSGAVPIKLIASHMVLQRGASVSMLPSIMNAIETFRRITPKTVLHVNDDDQQLRSELSAHGFVRDNIPESCGGSQTYAIYFKSWLQMRMKHGKAKQSTSAAFEAHECFEEGVEFSRKRTSIISLSYSQNSRNEDKRQKKRRMDIIYARRKRERERIEIEVLQERVTTLQSQNLKLRGENERFVSLLLGASNAAKLFDDDKSL